LISLLVHGAGVPDGRRAKPLPRANGLHERPAHQGAGPAAEQLVAVAHEVCPYPAAVRGNVEVALRIA
jgi:hypothetical protein